MRYSFVQSPDGPGGFGRLADDETGDLINFGAYYRMALERDALQAELVAERARRIKAEEVLNQTVDAITHLRYCGVCGEDSLEACDQGQLALKALAEARSLLAQYPRVEKENPNEG